MSTKTVSAARRHVALPPRHTCRWYRV